MTNEFDFTDDESNDEDTPSTGIDHPTAPVDRIHSSDEAVGHIHEMADRLECIQLWEHPPIEDGYLDQEPTHLVGGVHAAESELRDHLHDHIDDAVAIRWDADKNLEHVHSYESPTAIGVILGPTVVTGTVAHPDGSEVDFEGTILPEPTEDDEDETADEPWVDVSDATPWNHEEYACPVCGEKYGAHWEKDDRRSAGGRGGGIVVEHCPTEGCEGHAKCVW